MSGRIHKHAHTRLNFTSEVPVAARLAACRTFLRLESAMIRMRHDAGEPGLAVARARSELVDELLRHLFDSALAGYARTHGEPPSPVALVALGGYGRSELSPLSDIDIMFLFPSKAKPAVVQPLQQHLINEILYPLWDCGLKVGHSTRTVEEAFAEARKDIQTKTALLEARLIAGAAPLFEGFATAYRSFYTTEKPLDYIAARLADQADRRAKHGHTVFLQEPDIKNGVGGLRDFQNAVWMARVKFGVTGLDELAAQNYLRKSELRDFQRAYDFLLRARNELHFLSKRPTDLLDLAVQPRVAAGLGYANRDELGRIEQFMHDYYRAAQTIHRIAKIAEHRLALGAGPAAGGGGFSFRSLVRATRFQKTKRVDGFIVRGSELGAETEDVFRADPVRLVRVFRHCQQLQAQPDFALQTLIHDSLPLITRKVRQSADACISFRAILDEAGAVFPTLSLMHELGVLGRFIPEFKALTCLVQHEFYHRYTADIHTLNTIRELDLIFTQADPVSLKYRATLHETARPTLLYLTLLLHDIGKARGIKGHAESGVEIARPFLARLGVTAAESELVVFLIKNHLAMARFWQKRDVDDPATATAFAQLVPDAEQLRFLYVHTYCDARGTAAGLWNGYKDTLHTGLYRATLEHLTHGPALAARHTQRLPMLQQELIAQKISGVSPEEITAHFQLLPERYFLQTDPGEIALHLRMVSRLLAAIAAADSVGSLRPVIEWHDDLNRSLTVVHVVTWDRAGLFYKLAGAFGVAGLSILGAKVISRTDHIAIDTFHVVDPARGGIVQNARAQDTFARTVEDALMRQRDLLPDILAQAKKHAASRLLTLSTGDTLHTSFPPTVDVYHELSMQRIIVEVQARDEIGLLFRLAKAISDHRFDITFARIGTERGVAIDTFYIEDENNAPLADAARLTALRAALQEIIAPTPPAEPPVLAAAPA